MIKRSWSCAKLSECDDPQGSKHSACLSNSEAARAGREGHSGEGLCKVGPGCVWMAVGCGRECGFYAENSGKPLEGFTQHDKRV